MTIWLRKTRGWEDAAEAEAEAGDVGEGDGGAAALV
jgi:hypothetical protein